MSTDISTKSVALSGGRNCSLFGVNIGQETVEDLAAYVQRIRHEKGLSQREVQAQSGKKISKGYIGQIENREVLGHSVTPQKLRALAKGLGVAEDEVFAKARGVEQVGGLNVDELSLLEYYRDLPDEFKRLALTQLKTLHDSLRPAEILGIRADKEEEAA
jgi:transcriptional regulator with XRE-family HTH domain